jgi:hypothetical protein
MTLNKINKITYNYDCISIVLLPGRIKKTCRKPQEFIWFLISVAFRYPQKHPSKRWLLPDVVG